jgi:hypothetical protein
MSERIIIHYIYLLIEREFLNSGEPVYTIGRSRRSHKKTTLLTQRVCEYPKGSKCISCRIVSDCYLAEDKIKKTFSQIFIQRKDIGIEYFEGDIELMKLEFIKIAEEYSVIESVVNNTDIDANTDDYNEFMFSNKTNFIDNLEKKECVKNVLNNNIEKIPKKINCFCCKKCDAVFKAKGDYNRHLNKKIPCDKEEKEHYKITQRTCKYCEVLYADVQSVGKHMKICQLGPNKTNKAEKLEQIIAQLSNQIKDQNDKISNMSRQMKEINAIQKYTL